MLPAMKGNVPASRTGSGELEQYFAPFASRIVGHRQQFITPYGLQTMVYADWTASGRLYGPIEERIVQDIGPFAANTHTESNETGEAMTLAYREARRLIKEQVHAGKEDVLFFCGTGMTEAVNKLQRLMGLRVPYLLKQRMDIPEEERPIVFVTHMEHHSNQLSWMESVCDVHILEPGADGLVDPAKLEEALVRYPNRKRKIGAFTACSNVTGIEPPYFRLAEIMHLHGGAAFVDFSASAPYVAIDMHPPSALQKLDAIYFSPHKFLGGPGSSGILVMDSRLIASNKPDRPGGGTVLWTDRWGGFKYITDLEDREDGGTPGFLQAFRAALCFRLKEQMGIDLIRAREAELTEALLNGLGTVPGIALLDGHIRNRMGVLSFHTPRIHYPLFVRLLNDYFGIQARGGCACAGTYGHFLFDLDSETSAKIMQQVENGNLAVKPGFVRISLHPVMTDDEIRWIVRAVAEVDRHGEEWSKDYVYDALRNDYRHKDRTVFDITRWFELSE